MKIMKIMKNDYLKYLLPLVAVVVIIESIMLITGMEDKEKEMMALTDKDVAESVMLEEETLAEEPMVSLSFATESRRMEVGQDYGVEVNLTALEAVRLDSLEVYVAYDPEVFDISGLTTNNDLPAPIFSEVSNKKNLVVVNYMVVDKDGYAMNEAKVVSLMSFRVRPLKAGSFDLGFATGVKGGTSVTMFVGSGNGQALPFSINGLNIEVE